MRQQSERGAVAVEFAILAPVLIMIILGTIEFGRAYNTQVTLTNAAREGVRVMAINKNETAARDATKKAALFLNPALADSNIAFSPTPTLSAPCPAGSQMNLTISYTLSTLTGIAGPFPMKGSAVMVCGG